MVVRDDTGKCIAKAACPSCGSGDGVQIFEKLSGKRDAYCFACEKHYNRVDGLQVIEEDTITQHTTPKISMSDIRDLKAGPLPERGLREDTLEAFGVKLGYASDDPNRVAHHFYPSYHLDGTLQGYDHREVDGKKFSKVGKTKDSQLFGQNIRNGGKKLFVTEGHCDAMALFQAIKDTNPPAMTAKGYLPSVVSITNGISGALTQLENNSKFLATFKEIVLVFDSDTAGRSGAEKVAKSLDHKVLIADLPLKDANDMVLAGREQELREAAVFNAVPYEPDGIMNGKDCWERYKTKQDIKCHPYPEQFSELNRKTYGWRSGTVVAITSGSGMGKTQFCRELAYDIGVVKGIKTAIVALEEDVGDSVEGLMAVHLSKRISLPDVAVTKEEETKAFDEVFGSGMFELYDHFGGMSDSSLFSRLRYFATYLNCKAIILDHLSIVISETADEGDERRRIDAVMTKLAVMAKALDVVIFLVIHLRKAGQGKSFEEGYVPTSDDLRGSASIKQLSHDILALSRNQQEEDDVKRNTSGIHVLKCRFSGDTGQAGYTFFNPTTGRLTHSEDPHLETVSEESEF